MAGIDCWEIRAIIQLYLRITTMYRDEVIEEVWRIRDEYVKQHHYSLDEIVEDLRCRQAETSIANRG